MDRKFRSKNEQVVYSALTKLYPNCRIETQYYLGEGIYLDFLVHSTLKIGIEVDGDQHYNYNAFYHETIADFSRQKMLDSKKEDRCADLGITLVRIDGRKNLYDLDAMALIVNGLREREYTDTGALKEAEKRRKDARRTWSQAQYRRWKDYKKMNAR